MANDKPPRADEPDVSRVRYEGTKHGLSLRSLRLQMRAL